MNFTILFEQCRQFADSEKSTHMSAYMRNQFLFLGISTQVRKTICKDFFKRAKKEKFVDWKFVQSCWICEYRELQYIAKDYLVLLQKFLTPSDIPKIEQLIVKKSWWDTVDGLDRIVGCIALQYPELNEILIKWSLDDNIWLRRISIDHQLLRKDKTNTQLLEQIIKNNLNHKEFFINKAIGWSLRDYSKTNPLWVKAFVTKYKDQMSTLSIKEASKYI